MQEYSVNIEQRQTNLIRELERMDTFRRGSVNSVYRKCGKKGCVCAEEGHPGHGPMTTLTFKEKNRTTTRSIPSPALNLVRKQIEARGRFSDWCDRWRELNEEKSDREVDRLIEGVIGEPSDKKKSLRPWSKKSGGKSKR